MKILNRRSFMKSALTGTAAAVLPGCSMLYSGNANAAHGQRPNVLLITTDQQRKDSLSVYESKGCPVKTPTVTALARDGMVFDRAYIASTTCTPSRASILTGQYPSRHGAYSIGTTLAPDTLKVTDELARAGYVNYAIGKMHFTPVSTTGRFESPPNILDEPFWRTFDGPYYGFHHNILLNRHTSESLSCRMHYGVWLKDQGLTEADLKKYFNNQRGMEGHPGRWNLPRDYHPSTFVAESAARSILEHKSRHGDKPFFMWVSFQDPHRPHVVPAPYDTMYDPKKVDYLGYRPGEHDDRPDFYNELFSAPKKFYARFPGNKHGVPCAASAGNIDGKKKDVLRKEIAIHFGMATLVDDELKKVIDALKRIDQYHNTLIIYTTDHGDYLGNHGFHSKGFPAFEEVYNVPLIVKNPAQSQAGKRSSELVSLVDLAPTVLAMAECKIPAVMEGLDHSDAWRGKGKMVRDNLIIENRPIPKGFYQQMLVTRGHKLVAYMDTTQGELYDMQKDPDQYENLWNKPEHEDLKRRMLMQLIIREPTKKAAPAEVKGLSVEELLNVLWEKMHAEEPVQPRTSFS
jgi:uncharacterized sulfatase